MEEEEDNTVPAITASVQEHVADTTIDSGEELSDEENIVRLYIVKCDSGKMMLH